MLCPLVIFYSKLTFSKNSGIPLVSNSLDPDQAKHSFYLYILTSVEYIRCGSVYILSGLFWMQTICKGHQQITKDVTGKDLTLKAPITAAADDKFWDISHFRQK